MQCAMIAALSQMPPMRGLSANVAAFFMWNPPTVPPVANDSAMPISARPVIAQMPARLSPRYAVVQAANRSFPLLR